jgi:glycosyltransferase involved in cell wall biosynthesis
VEGQVSRERVAELVGSVSAVAVPSVGGEGLPRLLAEAFSAGRPVVTVNREPLSSLVGPTRGWVAEASSASLSMVLSEIATADARRRLKALGAAARDYYVHHFAPDVVLRHQLSTYASVIGGPT